MRRHFLLLVLALNLTAWTCVASAQPDSKVPVIGVLMVVAGPQDPVVEAMRRGLRDLGYEEHRNYRFEHRSAEGDVDRLAGLAEELARMKVDVIVNGTEVATRAAKHATTTIPIVTVLPEHDPVAAGFIESFNHPGHNITGLTVRNSQLGAKRLELLKEILPGLTRVAVLSDPSVHTEVEAIRPAAREMGVEVQVIEMTPPYDFDSAFAAAKRRRVAAVMLLSSPQVYSRRLQLGALALRHGLAVDAPFHDLARTGGLIAYSTDVTDGFYRSAYFIVQLLKGAKAAELPFEQTANVKLVVNLRTAKRLRLSVPESVLLRADEVIR